MPAKKTNPKTNTSAPAPEPVPTPEPVSGETVATATPVADPLVQLQAENAALKERAARAVADYRNLERRQREDRAKTIDYARQEIFTSLLQPLEHLALAAAALHDQGLDMVVKQFRETLAAQGLQELAPVGQPFDAASMEAIEKVGPGETVQEVVARGWQLGERVIRPAKVKVG